MSEDPQEDALREADAVVSQALREVEARCTVLAGFIDASAASGSKTAAWSAALREFHALHGYRVGLMRRRNLISQALEYPVGECPVKVPLPAVSKPVVRTQQQVQVQVRARRRARS
jgi:hypothetical protein